MGKPTNRDVPEVVKGLFVGLTTVDALYLLDTYPRANQKAVASRYGLFAGGPATNAAITFALLGGDATLVSAVGTSALGALVRHELAQTGVALTDCAPSPDFAPVLSSIFSVAATGTRNVVTASATPRLSSTPSTPIAGDAASSSIDFAELLRAADVLLLDGHHLPHALPAARAARERGIPVVLDGGSWKVGLDAFLPFVDVAICSEDFRLPETPAAATAAAAASTSIDTIRGLRARGVPAVAVSRGEKPLVYATDEGFGEIPVPIPTSGVVDTLGAGDVLHGAFALFYARYARSRDFALALQRAARVASFSCGCFGPREGVALWRDSHIAEREAP